jgi:hypothetical protein
MIDPKNWLPLKEAAHLLQLSRHTIVRLCEEADPLTRKPYLRGWRPSPGTLLISRESLDNYCTATQADPEFWAQRNRRILHRSGSPRRVIRRNRSPRPNCPQK